MASRKSKRKYLTRSQKNRVICGVIGGFCQYIEDKIDLDPIIWRAAYVLITAFTGFAPGIVAYFVLCLIIPKAK